MTMTVNTYASKKELKEAVGQPLRYEETSLFGEEYTPDGVLTVARRPHLAVAAGLPRGREFFARVHMSNGLIVKVE